MIEVDAFATESKVGLLSAQRTIPGDPFFHFPHHHKAKDKGPVFGRDLA